MNTNFLGPIYGVAASITGVWIGWRITRQTDLRPHSIARWLMVAVIAFGGAGGGALLTALADRSESLDWVGIGLVAFSVGVGWGVFIRAFYDVYRALTEGRRTSDRENGHGRMTICD